MEATGWRRRGSGGSAVRRPGATSSLPNASRVTATSQSIAPSRGSSARSSRPSNQPENRSCRLLKSVKNDAEVAPSRWREMRQSVRIKATLETPKSRPGNANIADLCPEDREKVTKLVRRIVEVGTLQEEGEKEFQRQKEVLDAEVQELRGQVKRDTEEIEELSEALHSATMKTKMFQQRVEVLEESTDAETRSRLETEQTLDLLKLEVDKLRALVRRQQEEMEVETKERQERFDDELRRVNLELKETQELLLQERQERVLEKQRALHERLERSAAMKEKSVGISAPPLQKVVATATNQVVQSDALGSGQLDISSFLNTSVELPEKIKEIMDDWKHRMEEALVESNSTERNATKGIATTEQDTIKSHESVVAASIGCQTDGILPVPEAEVEEKELEAKPVKKIDNQKVVTKSKPDIFATPVTTHRTMVQSTHVAKRLDFDTYISALGLESEEEAPIGNAEIHCDVEDVNEQKSKVEGGPNHDEQTLQETEKQSIEMKEASSDVVSQPFDNSASSSNRNEAHRGVPTTAQSAVPTVRHKHHSRKQHDCVARSSEDDDGGNEADISNFPDISFLNVMNGDHLRQRGLRQGMVTPSSRNATYGGLYETSLFDVVDAIEKTQQQSPTHQIRQPSEPRSLADRFQQRYPEPIGSSSPSTRVESLRKHVEARERALYQRYDSVHPQSQAVHPADARNAATASSAMDGLAVFEEVKDLYAEDLFTSNRWGAFTDVEPPAASRDQLHASWPLSSRDISHLANEGEAASNFSSRGATLELSVQESIEKDMKELLRSENLQSLTSSQY